MKRIMLHTELWEQIFILVRSPYVSVAVLSAQLSESAATEKELVDFFSIHFVRSLSLFPFKFLCFFFCCACFLRRRRRKAKTVEITTKQKNWCNNAHYVHCSSFMSIFTADIIFIYQFCRCCPFSMLYFLFVLFFIIHSTFGVFARSALSAP